MSVLRRMADLERRYDGPIPQDELDLAQYGSRAAMERARFRQNARVHDETARTYRHHAKSNLRSYVAAKAAGNRREAELHRMMLRGNLARVLYEIDRRDDLLRNAVGSDGARNDPAV